MEAPSTILRIKGFPELPCFETHRPDKNCAPFWAYRSGLVGYLRRKGSLKSLNLIDHPCTSVTPGNGTARHSTLLVRPIQCHLPWAGKQSEALLEGAEHGVAATSAAGGGSDAVTERRENCGRIPPLLRIIVYYQYFMINVCRYISPNTSPPNPELGPFCGNGCCRLIDILLHCC